MTDIIVAVISAIVTITVVLINNHHQTDKIIAGQEAKQAVTDTKIVELTREVREHNNFARRMPVLENEVQHLSDRIDKLEKE